MASADLNEPWFVASWPGMGGVAQIAASYLVQKLEAREIAHIDPEGYFEVQAISVRHGIVQDAQIPQSRFFAWKNPGSGRDLLIFLGEAQPTLHGYRFCEELLEVADEYGAKRVLTFAAMATAVHPSANPRVLGVATDAELLKELRKKNVELLEEGQIGGLNGVLLAAAVARGERGACLLGEFPYFASAVPNPKASAAVLRVFADMARFKIDMGPIEEQGQTAERNLLELLNQLQQAAGMPSEAEPNPGIGSSDEIDPEVEARIETLFRQAAQDREKAVELKAELDRQELFRRYEDRFLDLFRNAE